MTTKQLDRLLSIIDRAVKVAERWADREYPLIDETKKPPSAGLEIVPSPKASKSTTPSSRRKIPSKGSPKGSALVSTGSRAANAILRRLDIDPAEVALMPREPAEILTRCLGDGKRLPRQRILSFAAVSNDAVAVAFMGAIRKIPALDLKQLSFEAMCVRARVSPVALMGAVVVAAKSMKATESALKAILAHPEVVQATVDAATEGTPVLVGGKPVLTRRAKYCATITATWRHSGSCTKRWDSCRQRRAELKSTSVSDGHRRSGMRTPMPMQIGMTLFLRSETK